MRWFHPQPATGLAASVSAVRDGAGHDGRRLQHMRCALAGHGHDVQPDEFMAALDACAAQARQQLLQSPRASPA